MADPARKRAAIAAVDKTVAVEVAAKDEVAVMKEEVAVKKEVAVKEEAQPKEGSNTQDAKKEEEEEDDDEIRVIVGLPGEIGAVFDAFAQEFRAKDVAVRLINTKRDVDRLPAVGDVDQTEQDMMRGYFQVFQDYWHSKNGARVREAVADAYASNDPNPAARFDAGASAVALADRPEYNQWLVSRIKFRNDIRARTIHKISAEIDKEIEDVAWKEGDAGETAPAPVPQGPEERAPTEKDYRPRGTAPPGAALRQDDFPDKSLDLRPALTDKQITIKKKGFKRKDTKNDFFNITWHQMLMDDIETVQDYTVRRLTALLQGSTEISQDLCNRAFDDAVEYLLRARVISLKTYSRDDRSAWWKKRQDAAGVKTQTRRQAISVYYVDHRKNNILWRHALFPRGGGGATIIDVAPGSTRDVDPPTVDSPLPISPEPANIAGKADSEMVDGFTVATHRRARAWVYYEAVTWYEHMFGKNGNWAEIDSLTLGAQLAADMPRSSEKSKKLRKEQRIFRCARNVGRRGRAPFVLEINTHANAKDDWYIHLDTQFDFGSVLNDVFKAQPSSKGFLLLGLRMRGREDADALCRFMNAIYFDSGGDWTYAVTLAAWVSNVFALNRALKSGGKDNRKASDVVNRGALRSAGHKCSGETSVHVPDCCGNPTTCDQMKRVGSSIEICSACNKLIDLYLRDVAPKEEGRLSDSLVYDIKRRWKDDYVLTFATQTHPDFVVPSAQSVLDALAARRIPDSNDRSGNPLLNIVVHQKAPVATRKMTAAEAASVSNVADDAIVTSMFSAENLSIITAGEARLAYAYGLDATKPLLENMQRYQKFKHGEVDKLDVTSDLLDQGWNALVDETGACPFFDVNAAGAAAFRRNGAINRAVAAVPYERRKRAALSAEKVQQYEAQIAAAAPAAPVAAHGRRGPVPSAQVHPDVANVARLTAVVEQMEVAHHKKGAVLRRLPRGKDGLPCPFTGETGAEIKKDWCYDQMKKFFGMTVRRTIMTCNLGYPIDASTGFESHFLNACYSAINDAEGLCPIIGLPFVREPRSHARMSMAHIRHGASMNSGWAVKFPSNLDQLDLTQRNICGESWAANYYKSNFAGVDIDAHLAHVARNGFPLLNDDGNVAPHDGDVALDDGDVALNDGDVELDNVASDKVEQALEDEWKLRLRIEEALEHEWGSTHIEP